MLRSLFVAAGFALVSAGQAMAQERILITSEWGSVKAKLADNAATRALVRSLPVTVKMSDHLRQEKTGNLPSPLPEAPRQRGLEVGTLGLWGTGDFVIYYRAGQVPPPASSVLASSRVMSRYLIGPARSPSASCVRNNLTSSRVMRQPR